MGVTPRAGDGLSSSKFRLAEDDMALSFFPRNSHPSQRVRQGADYTSYAGRAVSSCLPEWSCSAASPEVVGGQKTQDVKKEGAKYHQCLIAKR